MHILSETPLNDANLDFEMKKDFKTDFHFKDNVEMGYFDDLIFFLQPIYHNWLFPWINFDLGNSTYSINYINRHINYITVSA